MIKRKKTTNKAKISDNSITKKKNANTRAEIGDKSIAKRKNTNDVIGAVIHSTISISTIQKFMNEKMNNQSSST